MFQRVFSFFNLKRNNRIKLSSAEKELKSRRIREVFSNIPRLETQRLILRRIREIDYIDMHEYSADAEVTKYLVWQPHKTIEETKKYTGELQQRYAEGKFYDWGLVHKADSKLIGTCGLTTINLNKNSCEIGYVLSKKYWGQGFIPEALGIIMDFAFTYLDFERIEGRFFEGNEKSCRVMQKMGMVFDRVDYKLFHIKGEYKNIYNYYITREMFEEKKYALYVK